MVNFRNVYNSLTERKAAGKKSFAVLIDPDKMTKSSVNALLELSVSAGVNYFFVGGSLITSNYLEDCVKQIKSFCNIPVLLFPGSPAQITDKADALLYLSLISSRNAELLIGHHVISAPFVRKSGLEVLPTGYMLIDGGAPTTVSYISNSLPIPSDKAEIAMCTAMAGEMLGMKLIYLDAGSGAQQPVPLNMISKVASAIEVPVIVGGGVKTAEQAYLSCKAGADVLVIGNALEKDPTMVIEIASAIQSVPIKSL